MRATWSHLLAATLLFLGACAESPTEQPDAPRPTVVPEPFIAASTAQEPTTPTYSLDISTSEEFHPGQPITFTVTTKGLRRSANAALTVLSLDHPKDDVDARDGVRELVSWRGNLQRGATRTSTVSLVFRKAGYYRVLFAIRGTNLEPAGDTAVLTGASRTLWLVVDDKGGRLTSGYEEGVTDSTKTAEYGSYGPFQPRFRQPQHQVDQAFASGASIQAGGTFRYIVEDSAVENYVGVPGAKVTGNCVGRSSPLVVNPDVTRPFATSVGPTGYFQIVCPAGVVYDWRHIAADISLRGSFADAGDQASFTLFDQDSVDLHARSNTGARVFLVLENKVPIANAKFGASRTRIPVTVSDAAPHVTTGYYPATDELRYSHSDVWVRIDRYAIILHEYGHAFQYDAIEPPWFYSCPNGTHGESSVTSPVCALVEGFAEFFAAWIGGDVLINDRGTDNRFEENPYRSFSAADGYMVEGAVAGFFYDLVDDASSPDSPSNTADGDDDTVSYTGSDVRFVLSTCVPQMQSGESRPSLNGIDQFIFCAERSVAAETLSNPANANWFYFGWPEHLSAAIGTHAMNAAKVRELWLCNLYNQGC